MQSSCYEKNLYLLQPLLYSLECVTGSDKDDGEERAEVSAQNQNLRVQARPHLSGECDHSKNPQFENTEYLQHSHSIQDGARIPNTREYDTRSQLLPITGNTLQKGKKFG